MKQLAVLLFFILLSLQAYGSGLYGEPLVNSLAGQFSQDATLTGLVTGTAKAEGDLSGYQYGGRVG